ncbi:MAG: prephenate dehydrogenase [Flavobacteriaceae bacterium TMED179]|nr:MAG: prephenate dehydrogenase [Flavobacteriaceae bacterium TMED179]|tara:strand:+ start:8903 stop:9751 length:849 start_codon:yes stop_codon:yes gene_type:complete
MNIGVIGLGLIGGSFALSAKRHIKGCNLYGEDQSEKHLKQALKLEIVEHNLKPSNYSIMDVIILAIPVDSVIDKALYLLDYVNDNTLLIDVGSTKAKVCKEMELHPKRNQFLATHPIAGTEFSGPSAAFVALFSGKPLILCESNKTRPDLLEWAINWFKNIGMELQEMDPKEHDKHIAYVSHLSHISSFMLGKTVMEKEQDEKAIFDMAGSGFASTVRLAKSSPSMWAPIFEQNQENILEVLDEYIANLEEFKLLMEQQNYKEVFRKMQQTNSISKILAGIN